MDSQLESVEHMIVTASLSLRISREDDELIQYN